MNTEFADLYYDFHIHSCLSPCAENDMTPYNIAGMAALKELDVIALTDHNSCKNCRSLIMAAKPYDITVIPGMELCTEEEIHVVCLFSSLYEAEEFDKYIYSLIPDIKNNSEIYGNQYIMNEEDLIIGEEKKLLVNACSLSIAKLPDVINFYKGVCFPAHIDRNSYSLISTLGGIPAEYGFSAAEISAPEKIDMFIEKYPALQKMRILTNSDAHYLWDINERYYYMKDCKNTACDIISKLKEKENLC